MRVRCVNNKISNLPADSIVARQKRHYFGNDDFVHLTPNKTYVVANMRSGYILLTMTILQYGIR